VHLFDLNKMLQQEMTAYISRGMDICAAMHVDESNVNGPSQHVIRMKALERYKILPTQLMQIARQGPEGLLRQMDCATDEEVRQEIENANNPRLISEARPSDSIVMNPTSFQSGGEGDHVERLSTTDPDPRPTAFLSPASMHDVNSLPGQHTADVHPLCDAIAY
jgi:hypothetical protein